MKKYIFYNGLPSRILATLSMVVLSCTVFAQIPRIIFDTDLSSDWDDVGDFAIVHGLASLGECEIIGMGVSSSNGGAALCMKAMNIWYGKPDIPIAVRPDVGGVGGYPGIIASEYPHGPEKTPQDFPLAETLYRQLLASSPDKSVTIVTVGYLNNLEALLKSQPDEYSDLDGFALVRKKVKLWACAGGSFPSGGEFNFGVEPEAAYYVVNNWPTAVTYTPYHMGHDYMTCGRLPIAPADNPIRRVYVDIQNNYPYPSWGQTAIYNAVRGYGQLWTSINTGRNNANEDGTNYWTESPDPEGEDDQAYLVGHARTPVRDGIDALIMLPPNDGTPSKPGEPTDLRANVVGADRIDLEWTDNAYNETSFVIEKRVDGSYTQVATVGADVTSYSVQNLDSIVNQSFRVKARNAQGDSRYATTWVYSGWTETNFQNASQLPLYEYYQTCHLRHALNGGPNHITVNNDSTHGQTLTIDVDAIALAQQGNLYVYFFYRDHDNWYRLNMGLNKSKFEKSVNGVISQIGDEGDNLSGGNVSLRPWRITVTPDGDLKFIDEGVVIVEATDVLSFSSGKIGLGGLGRNPVWENFRFDTSSGGPPVEEPPLPPSGLVAISGDAEVALSWNAMYGADSYTIKYDLDRLETFIELATVTSPAYLHKDLLNGTRYYYTVSANNNVGTGQISKRFHGTPYASGGGPGGSNIIGTPGSWGGHDNTIHKVFDGNLTTIFDAPVPSGAWVGLDYETPRIFTKILYAPSPFHPQRMIGGVFQGANDADFSDAIVLHTIESAPAVNVMTTQSVANATAFRYVRYLGPDHGFCNIAELNFILDGDNGEDDGNNNGGDNGNGNGGDVPEEPVVEAPAITSHPQNMTVNEGQPASFSVAASGTAPLSYIWKFNDSVVDESSATFSISSVQMSDAGVYTCTVTNSAGLAISNPATLTVNPLESPDPPDPPDDDFVVIQDTFFFDGWQQALKVAPFREPDTVNLPESTWGITAMSGWVNPYIPGSGWSFWPQNTAYLEHGLTCMSISLGDYNTGRLRIQADVALTTPAAEGIGLGFKAQAPSEGFEDEKDPRQDFTGLMINGDGLIELVANGTTTGNFIYTAALESKRYYPLSYNIDIASGDIYNIKFNDQYLPDLSASVFTPAATKNAAFITGDQSGGAVDNFVVTAIADASDPPVVGNSMGATEVSGGNAVLNGVLYNGGPAKVYVYYGPDPDNWSNTNHLSLVQDGLFSVAVSGLELSTTYFYQCLASNTFGSAWAPEAAYFVSGAQSYTWTGNAGNGYWNDPDNWDPDTGFPNSARETAVFTHSPTTPATTVTLNQSSIRVGGIVMNPGNSSSEEFTVTTNGLSQVLIFDNASDPAFIDVSGSKYGGIIGAPVQLVSDLEVSTKTSGNNYALTFTGSLAGPGKLVAKSGRIGLNPLADEEYDLDITGGKSGGSVWKRGSQTAKFTRENSVLLSGDSHGQGFIGDGGAFVVSGGSFTDQGTAGAKILFATAGGNELIVTNGGKFTFQKVDGSYPRLYFNTKGNTVAVSGAGSILNLANNEFYIDSHGGRFVVNDGGRVSGQKGIVGWGTSGNSVLISGTSSEWDLNDIILCVGVGPLSMSNSVTIADGGVVRNTFLWMGYSYYNEGGGSFNSLVITNGGKLYSGKGDDWGWGSCIGLSGQGKTPGGVPQPILKAHDNTALVSGADSIWDTQGKNLAIGLINSVDTGGWNRITVNTGGMITNVNDLYVGRTIRDGVPTGYSFENTLELEEGGAVSAVSVIVGDENADRNAIVLGGGKLSAGTLTLSEGNSLAPVIDGRMIESVKVAEVATFEAGSLVSPVFTKDSPLGRFTLLTADEIIDNGLIIDPEAGNDEWRVIVDETSVVLVHMLPHTMMIMR